MLQVFHPPLHLAQYVVCFWLGRFVNSTPKAFTHLAHATSTPQLLFHLDGVFVEEQTKTKVLHAGLYGHGHQYKRYTTTCRHPAIFGVQLYPHALPALFSIDSCAITNRSIDLSTLLGAEGDMLKEKVFEAKDESEVPDLIIDFLEERLRRQARWQHPGLTAAISAIHSANGNVNVPEIIQQSCLSTRHFERKFKELTGFAPKAYARVVRFESLLDQFVLTRNSLTDIALELGYYDQAHCNHDFKRFTGHSPSEYAALYIEQYF